MENPSLCLGILPTGCGWPAGAPSGRSEIFVLCTVGIFIKTMSKLLLMAVLPFHIKPDGGDRFICDAEGNPIVDLMLDTTNTPTEVAWATNTGNFLVKAANCHNELVAACKAQQEALDILSAMLIDKNDGFFLSRSGKPWDALLIGIAAIKKAEQS